jgi:hypothetical protein
MGADQALLIDGMRQWIQDLKTTNAYQEGRILGPGAWFTCKFPEDEEKWKHYLLWESELDPLAVMCMEEWQPGIAPAPDPDPDPNGDEVPYVVVVNLLPQDATLDEKAHVLNEVHDSKETILQSADDAARLVAPGQPGSKVKVWEPDRWGGDIDQWLIDHGVNNIDHLFF